MNVHLTVKSHGLFICIVVTCCLPATESKADQPGAAVTLAIDSKLGTARRAIPERPLADVVLAAVNPAEGSEATPRAPSEKILQALGTSTTVDFQGVPLTDALGSLGKNHNIKVRVDNAALLVAKNSADARTVFLRMGGISLRAVLNMLLERESLGYFVDGDELVITTRQNADSRIEESVYDLRDAVGAGMSLADLGEAIVHTIGRGSWDQPGGAGQLRIEGTKIILRQRADVQRHVQNLLTDVQRALVAAPGVFEDDQLELKSYPIADLRREVSDADLGNWLRESLLIETSLENVGRADLKIEGDQMQLKQPPWLHAATAKYLATVRERGKREPARHRTREDFSFAKAGLQAEARRQIVKKQLAKPLAVNFQELPTDDALTYLTEASGIKGCFNFKYSEARKRGVKLDLPVTFRANESFAALIDKVLTGLAVDWHVAEPGLIVLELQAQDGAMLEPRAYGIRELCDHGHTVEGLMSLIKDLAPGSWAATGGPGNMRPLTPGLLIVSHTRRMHNQIDRLLDKLVPVR